MGLALFLACLLAAGSAGYAPVNRAVIDSAGIALLVWLGLTWTPVDPPAARVPFILIAGLLLLTLAQLVPLPFGLWTLLPGRGLLVDAVVSLPALSTWHPTSLYPFLTLRMLGALAPIIALFIWAVRGDTIRREAALVLIVASALASALLGMLQFLSGDASLFLYPNLAVGVPSGLFSNRNHQVTLMAIAVPIVLALTVTHPRALTVPINFRSVVALLLVAVLVLSAAVTRSRSFFVIMLPSLFLSALMLHAIRTAREPAIPRSRAVRSAFFALLMLASLLVATVATRTLLPRFAQLQSDRLASLPDLLWAFQLYWPFGSGFGTFVPVHASAESLAVVDAQYLNHAHNEYLQIAIEGGAAALALVLAFLAWFVLRLWMLLRGRVDPIALACAIGVLLLLVHSGFDYPLRTGTHAAILAVLCAVLAHVPARQNGDETLPNASGSAPAVQATGASS